MRRNAKITVLCLAASTAIWAAGTLHAQEGPAIVLPEEDLESASDALSPNQKVLSMLRDQIAERYLADGPAEIDRDRLDALLSGDYIADYHADARNPVQFSNGVFQRHKAAAAAATEEPADVGPEKPEPAEEGFQLTPAAIRAMSSMSPDQIEAIALMVQLAQDPDISTINPQAALDAIPSLSDEELDSTSPEELLASLTAAAPPAKEPRVVDVGNGQTLGLENWQAILSPDGTVELSNATLPGSRFSVQEGMAVGQFGLVTKVSADPLDLYVEFETGDRISGEAFDFSGGIPALEDRSIYGGEILVSEVPDTLQPELPEGSKPDKTQAGTAVMKSLRPLMRPEGFHTEASAVAQDGPDHPQTNPSRL